MIELLLGNCYHNKKERRSFAVVGVPYLSLVTSSDDGLASAGATVHAPADTAAAAVPRVSGAPGDTGPAAAGGCCEAAEAKMLLYM